MSNLLKRKLGIFGFLIFNINSICASSSLHDTNMNINWWNIGAKYSNEPALGWTILTFAIFLLILVYFGSLALSKTFSGRSYKIRKDFLEARLSKITAKKKLDKYNKKINALNINLKNILEEFKVKKNYEKIDLEVTLKELSIQIKTNIDYMIQAHIRKIKMDLKKHLIDDIIKEVLFKIKSDKLNSMNKTYETKIVRDISTLKTNF